MNVNVNLMIKNKTQIKSRTTKNLDVSANIKKNMVCARKIIFGSLVHVLNGVYLESIIDDSLVTCDEIIATIKTIPVKATAKRFNEKEATNKVDNFYIWFAFLLATILLFIITCIYCHHIKH